MPSQQAPQCVDNPSIRFFPPVLTLMMTLCALSTWTTGSAESAQRVVVRHRVSLTFNLPGFYREKIRSYQGGVRGPISCFGGIYKDPEAGELFCSIGTDPEIFQGIPDIEMPLISSLPAARPSGMIVDSSLAKKVWMEIGRPHRFAGDYLIRSISI